MKEILNWRWWIIYTLLSVGLLALFAIFGDDERPLEAWIEVRIYLAILSFACLYTMHRLRQNWEIKGKISNNE